MILAEGEQKFERGEWNEEISENENCRCDRMEDPPPPCTDRTGHRCRLCLEQCTWQTLFLSLCSPAVKSSKNLPKESQREAIIKCEKGHFAKGEPNRLQLPAVLNAFIKKACPIQ